MSKVKGIDISKATFDVSWKENGKTKKAVFANETKGFEQFFKVVEPYDHCIMEASGPYYLNLAVYLHSKGIKVSVANPLSVKRFCQMKLVRTKTDKKDAAMIAAYGELTNPAAWEPEEAHIAEMRDLLSTLEGYEKQITQLSNQLGSQVLLPVKSTKGYRSRLKMVRSLEKEVTALEKELELLANKHCGETMKKLQTIPGIGPKTSVFLVVLTGNFQKFEEAKKLSAYIGICPRIYQSGSSIKGKGHICKMGNARARKLLFMCSWSAQFYNPHCKELRERLEKKGKPSRVIKVALANKLLRIAFAVAKKNTSYDKNISPKTCF